MKKKANVLSKNERFRIIENISDILEGTDNLMENLNDLNSTTSSINISLQ